jgi:hypothetical protein
MKQKIESRGGRRAAAAASAVFLLSASGCMALENSSGEISADDSNRAMLTAGRIVAQADDAKPERVEVRYVDSAGVEVPKSDAVSEVKHYATENRKRVYNLVLYRALDETASPSTYNVTRLETTVDCLNPGSPAILNCDPAQAFSLVQLDIGSSNPNAGWAAFSGEERLTDAGNTEAVAARALGLPANG